jgi:hypothetical protein
MRTSVTLATILVTAGLAGDLAAADRKPGLHRVLAQKLVTQKTRPRGNGDTGVPQTHITDFAGDAIGCITLQRWEMRSFGYPGHAFACEEAARGEVLGAVLDRHGRRLCFIDGFYAGDDCYELTICDVPETLCLQ